MSTFVPVVGADDLAALLRVVVGAAFVTHGLPKIRGGWKQAGQWIQSLGVPAGGAMLATLLEFFGGILLVVGLLVPFVASLFAVQMAAIIAMKKFRMRASFVSMSPDKPSYEIDVVYLLLALVLVVLGAGPLSMDSLLGI